MQQIFLFFIMLITASEAFLNGSYISTSNKKKISGFVPNARILKYVKLGNMDFPRKIDAEPGTISPRERSTFLNLCARHKRFSNGDSNGLDLDDVRFVRNRKFLNKRGNSSRRLRSMRRKRKLTSLFPTTKTLNLNSYPGSENSSVPSVISVFDSPLNSSKFYGKALYPKSRSKVVKKKQIEDLPYLPFNSKQLLKYSNLRVKRRGRMESRNVRKDKRDAQTANVSQANVTKDANEKNLDEESNDSLNDTYSQDLRPEFETQHLDDTPSNWQKYLGLNSQTVSPYLLPPMPDDIDYYDSALDIPPPSLFVPRMDFRLPYNRKIYEDTDFEDDENDAKFFRKSESEDIIEKKKNKKKKDKKSESYRLDKLNRLLDDVENALREEKGHSKSKMMRKGGRGGKPRDSEDSIRSKIEVVIPLLTQISQDLGRKSAQLPQITTERKLNISEKEDGEEKEMNDNKKKPLDCSLDGVWFSNMMGLEINVTIQRNLVLKVALKSSKNDALIDDKWSMHGLTLSKTEGPIMLAAICPGKGKMASFIGQCWMCEDDEYVYGSWTIYTKEDNIADLLTAVDTKLDVLTRKKDKEEVT